MRKQFKALLVVTAGLLSANVAFAGDAVLGAVIGGGVGAAVGHEVGGRDGAIVGGAVGAAAGAAIASDNHRHGRLHPVVVAPAPVAVYAPVPAYAPAPVYVPPPVYAPPPVYYGPPVRVVPAPVVYVPGHRYDGRRHWEHEDRHHDRRWR